MKYTIYTNSITLLAYHVMKYTIYTNSITLLAYHVMKYTFYTIILLLKMLGHGNINFT